ncbi:MAG: hypothetical protein LKJ25_06230 [Clostridia bacterium]|jgi:hypothetical protein|nr:hypothetical protein [Clostridia bacterium]
MQVQVWVAFIIVILMFVFLIVYMGVVLNSISEYFIAKKFQPDIDKSLINILQTYLNNNKYEQCLYEIESVMQRLVPKSSLLSKKYNTTLVLLECFLVDLNCEKITYKGDKEVFKKAIFDFIEIYKRRNPLEQINGSNYAVLKELLDNKDSEKQLKLVNQLAAELKNKEDMILKLQANNRAATILSVVGIALTIVFGIIAIIQSFF